MTERAMVEAVAEEDNETERIEMVKVYAFHAWIASFWFRSDGLIRYRAHHTNDGLISWFGLDDRPAPGESREAFALRIVGAKS